MGVPAFFKWLMLRYPNITMDAKELVQTGLDLSRIVANNYIDSAWPEIDNLYFDMNGIIHPCSHPQDRDAPTSLAEMFNAIFVYVDKIIRIIRPKKLIYLAIDGVAPRAKMNQQRSRRFRAAQEAQEKVFEKHELEKEWQERGWDNALQAPDNNSDEFEFNFDSNTITPGTKFLHLLSKCLITYIKSRLNNNSYWKDLTIIFSDANVPGEGEHKILNFIRKQRTYSQYDPNTRHCIYGADADLIMLGLIIHEPHFYLIRESWNDKMFITCDHCGKQGHTTENCEKWKREKNVLRTQADVAWYNKDLIDKIEFTLIKIPMIREYWEIEFKYVEFNFKRDVERWIDDFVFICFWVGNDFLPHLPSLNIREGAWDALWFVYKNILPKWDGYLTNGKGQINWSRCDLLFKSIGWVEDEFFKQEIINKNNYEVYKKSNNNNNNANHNKGRKKKNIWESFNSLNKERTNKDEIDLCEAALDIMERLEDANASWSNSINDFSKEEIAKFGKEKFKMWLNEKLKLKDKEKIEKYKDTIKFGEPGWKDRYYFDKFKMHPKSQDWPEWKAKIKQSYIEGICWVFEYYYNGCVSWEWFYPFHYAPFASDLTNVAEIKINFNLGKPFLPYEQLLSVLPPYSSDSLPKCLQVLMKDPCSEIADFYPSSIKLDINNQPYAWMGVNWIPFIEEKRIRKIIKEKIDKKEFSPDELERNKFGKNILISANKKSIQYVKGDYKESKKDTFGKKVKEDEFLEGLCTGNVNRDITKCFELIDKEGARGHSSVWLEGVELERKKVLMDNWDFYPKSKFKGQQAIEICRKILGFHDVNDKDNQFRNEYFDNRTYNNNRAIEYDPQTIHHLQKKRYKEGEADMRKAGFNYQTGKK